MRANLWRWQLERRTQASPQWPLPYPDGDPLVHGERQLILVLREWVYRPAPWLGTGVGNLPRWLRTLKRLRALDAASEVSPAERAAWAACVATDEPQEQEDFLRRMGLPWGGPRLYWYVQQLLCGTQPAQQPLRAALVTTLVFAQRDDPSLVGGRRSRGSSLTKRGAVLIRHDGNPVSTVEIDAAFLVQELQEAASQVQRRHVDWLSSRSRHLLRDPHFIQQATRAVSRGPAAAPRTRSYYKEATDLRHEKRLRAAIARGDDPTEVLDKHLDAVDKRVSARRERAGLKYGRPDGVHHVEPDWRERARAFWLARPLS
jgi:hypothetical protein